MVTRIFLFLLCVAISSCDSTEIQYKVCSHVECVDGMVTVETYVMKRSSGGWTMSEIYNNKRHTTVDSMKQIVKIEKQYAYEFVYDWLEIQGIRESEDISQ